jgi:transposase InsO family protein
VNHEAATPESLRFSQNRHCSSYEILGGCSSRPPAMRGSAPQAIKAPSILLNRPTHPVPTTFRYQTARSPDSLGAEGGAAALSATAPRRADLPGHQEGGPLRANGLSHHRQSAQLQCWAGYDCYHVAIDDATRLAFVEVLRGETRHSTTAFLVRALRWFRARGIRVERVMTDNGSGYVARPSRDALQMLGVRHIRTRPDTPKPHGKAERFIQTLLREWAYEIPFSSSQARTADPPRQLTGYNQQRPRVSLGGRTPAQALARTT